MKSSLKNMVLVLFSISLIASLCLGVVNMITKEPIAVAKDEAEKRALAAVLPEFDEVKLDSVHLMEAMEISAYKALKDEQVVGYAVKSASKSGFGGLIRLMVGFDTKGTILNVEVLEQKETPGLGTKMTIKDDTVKNPLLKINGRSASEINLTVKKDKGDVDALTAATISSRAYLDAVSRAYNVFKFTAGWSDKVEAYTGASKTDGNGESKHGNFEPKRGKEE